MQSYPWSCDVPAIVEAVADELGEPPAAALLAEGAAIDSN